MLSQDWTHLFCTAHVRHEMVLPFVPVPAWKTRVSLAEPWTLSGWESTPLLNAASPGGQIQRRLWCV